MKKVLLFFCLLLASSNCIAQKKYLILNYDSGCTLYGDIPEGMSSRYDATSSTKYKVMVDILNELSERGYVIEYANNLTSYLLSKNDSSNPSETRIVEIDNDEDVTEVARYNLQGMPISKHEKGVQIVVYSNYTTKTVIVQ